MFRTAEEAYRQAGRTSKYREAASGMRGWCLTKAGRPDLALPVLESCVAHLETALTASDPFALSVVRTLAWTIEIITRPPTEGTLLRVVEDAVGEVRGAKQPLNMYVRALVAVRAELEVVDGRPTIAWRNDAGRLLASISRPDLSSQRLLLDGWASWQRGHHRDIEVVDRTAAS
jgi:hypothetical protein